MLLRKIIGPILNEILNIFGRVAMRFGRFRRESFLSLLGLESAGSNALDCDEMFEDFANFAMMNNAKLADKGHAIAKVTGKFDNLHEILLGCGIFVISISKVMAGEIVDFQDHAVADGFTGELLGSVFVLVINEATDLIYGVVK